MSETNDKTHEHGDDHVIFRYTRAQAVDDGVLIDLTEWAKETGFTIPVACTATVWYEWIVPPDATRALGQSERGRAHDVLWVLYVAIRRGGHGDRLEFEVIFLTEPDRHTTVRLKAICGPGDNAEPVLTIMMPNED